MASEQKAVAAAPSSSSPSNESKWVRLNVGGVRYVTTQQTLMTKSAYFRALLSGRFALDLDASGARSFPLVNIYSICNILFISFFLEMR